MEKRVAHEVEVVRGKLGESLQFHFLQALDNESFIERPKKQRFRLAAFGVDFQATAHGFDETIGNAAPASQSIK